MTFRKDDSGVVTHLAGTLRAAPHPTHAIPTKEGTE